MFLRLKPFKSGLVNRLRLPASQWGMWCAHSGMIVFLIGALSSHFLASETIIRAKPGAQIEMGQHTILFDRIEQRQGPNFVTETALLHLQDKTGQFVAELAPEKRFYPAERQTTTEAAIRPRLSGDYYAVLGDGDMDKGFTLRLYHKPFVSWIWAGVFLMALGGLIALYRRKPLPTQ